MLLLWDIDGTLIKGARSAAQAFIAALREVYELPEKVAHISYGGKTDQQIVREILGHHDIYDRDVDERLHIFQERYILKFRELRAQLAQEVHVLPGVHALLTTLKPLATHALLTGNVQLGARLKLDAVQLSSWFNWEISAFGSDREQRDELVPLVLERAQGHAHAIPEKTIVIGDTPFDIQCARAGGVQVIAVATGSFDRGTLADYQPDALLDDLANTEQVIKVFQSLT